MHEFLKFIFWNKILHVSGSTPVNHQGFFTVHTATVYVILKLHKWVKSLVNIRLHFS